MKLFMKLFKNLVFAAILCVMAAIIECPAKAGAFPKTVLEKTVKSNKAIQKLYREPEKENDKKKAAEVVAWDEKYTAKDLRYMSAIIFCEANNMSHEAQVAVANVIINRMNNDSSDWNHVNTIKEVIYDNRWGAPQFSPTKKRADGTSSMSDRLEIYDNLEDYRGTWKYDTMLKCIESAKAAFSGEKAVPDSYLYFNGNIEKSKEKCINNNKSYKIIDGHIYF